MQQFLFISILVFVCSFSFIAHCSSDKQQLCYLNWLCMFVSLVEWCVFIFFLSCTPLPPLKVSVITFLFYSFVSSLNLPISWIVVSYSSNGVTSIYCFLTHCCAFIFYSLHFHLTPFSNSINKNLLIFAFVFLLILILCNQWNCTMQHFHTTSLQNSFCSIDVFIS